MSTDGSNLITDITPLALSDNFYTWFTRTNLLIDAINPLNIYDITPRKGLTESRSGGNVIIDIDTGKGLKAYPNDATGKLTLDFESLTAAASVANDDLFVIETPTTGVSNDVYKISASAMSSHGWHDGARPARTSLHWSQIAPRRSASRTSGQNISRTMPRNSGERGREIYDATGMPSALH